MLCAYWANSATTAQLTAAILVKSVGTISNFPPPPTQCWSTEIKSQNFWTFQQNNSLSGTNIEWGERGFIFFLADIAFLLFSWRNVFQVIITEERPNYFWPGLCLTYKKLNSALKCCYGSLGFVCCLYCLYSTDTSIIEHPAWCHSLACPFPQYITLLWTPILYGNKQVSQSCTEHLSVAPKWGLASLAGHTLL